MDKRIKALILVLTGIFSFVLIIYFCILPLVISNQKFINNMCMRLTKNTPFLVKIDNPGLKTYLNSDIDLEIGKISVISNNEDVFVLDNFKLRMTLAKLLAKKLYIKELIADNLYLDADKLLKLLPESEQKEAQPQLFNLDLYDSILSLKKAVVIYSPAKDTKITVLANGNIDNTQKEIRYVHFLMDTTISQPDKKLNFKVEDKNTVVIKDKKLIVDNCIFNVNKSKVYINALGTQKDGLKLNFKSPEFKVEDATGIVATNLVIANGREILSYLDKPTGSFRFDINMTPKGMDGVAQINSAKTKLVPLYNLPLNVTSGLVKITPTDIKLSTFEGFYGTNKDNKVTLEGSVKDYIKSCETNIDIITSINNEFIHTYLTPMVGVPLELTGKAGTKIELKSIYDKFDFTIMSKISKGDDILVDGVSLTPTAYDRAVKADMHLRGNLLNIENINYYIASELKKGIKADPVVTLRGQLDISTPVPGVNAFGFEIPKPLPSEFLNVLIGQKLFKGGKFEGKLYIVKDGENSEIKGKINSNNIRIPSQRLFLKQADLHTDKDTIHLVANGRYKRSKFDFTGDILSTVKFPVVIKDMNFTLDNLDVEKIMASFNQQPQTPAVIDNTQEDNDDDDTVTFDFNNIIIKRCMLNLVKGNYKDIQFGNLSANLTLNEKNILELKSNKFDIAEGISTIKVLCDLNKHDYYLRLGVKDVNSDLMSTTLLNLPREISGKARGLIEINTDDSLKLNGQIRFEVDEGQIQKIGLVEYLMKFLSVFRNPVATITPSIISDMVNIPEGNFDKITGDMKIKNNIIERMKIETISPQLGCLIIGRYNIETGDAALRIYTKFSNKDKGFGGFLRSFSLSSLANRIPLSSRSDSDYYSAELNMLPKIEAPDEDCQVFVTKVDGDLEHNNFLSSLKKLK